MLHAIYIPFLFALGACIGSFLNVVVWRLPRGESILTPPSHCPKCNKLLAWYDNVPILGWLWLRAKCRYCRQPISMRYPIVEAVTGLLFAFYYIMFFIVQTGPCSPQVLASLGSTTPMAPLRELDIRLDWAMYGLYMIMISGLLAASLIDAELYIIPLEICYVLAVVGFIVHGIFDTPMLPGALNVNPMLAALAAGGGVGLLISLLLWWRGILPTSFAEGEPIQESDRPMLLLEMEKAKKEGRPLEPLPPPYSVAQIRSEIGKEMLFLTPPLVLAVLWWYLTTSVAPIASLWDGWCQNHWVTGLLGSILGALVGAGVVWITRIFGTLGFGKVAMGLGDVHLMFGVGAIIGAGGATVAFFLAPFFGILITIYRLATRASHEIPFGPYLSMASAAVLLFYCPIAAFLAPGMVGLGIVIRDILGIG